MSLQLRPQNWDALMRVKDRKYDLLFWFKLTARKAKTSDFFKDPVRRIAFSALEMERISAYGRCEIFNPFMAPYDLTLDKTSSAKIWLTP